MNLTNATPKGATVFVTDLKIRVGARSVPISARDAVTSSDLRLALDQGMVRLEATSAEMQDPVVENLVIFAQLAEAKREGRLLFAQAEDAMINKRPVSSREVPIRPAVFENIM